MAPYKNMIKEPYWDKNKREWVLEYKINNKDTGEYVQRIRFETLKAVHTYIKAMNEKAR